MNAILKLENDAVEDGASRNGGSKVRFSDDANAFVAMEEADRRGDWGLPGSQDSLNYNAPALIATRPPFGQGGFIARIGIPSDNFIATVRSSRWNAI